MDFIDEAYRIMTFMWLPPKEKAELMAYKLKGDDKVWYDQWMEERGDEAGLIAWEKFKDAFFDWFFPLELRKPKVQVFINLNQGKISMGEYSLKFTKLSKYTPFIVADPRDRMNKSIFGVSELVSKECKTTMLVKKMNISCLMCYVEQIKVEKLREHTRESKRARLKVVDSLTKELVALRNTLYI